MQSTTKHNEDAHEAAMPMPSEETIDPLNLAKIVEARLRDSDATSSTQGPTMNFLPTNKGTQAADLATQKTAEYEEENVAIVDLARIMEARLQDSGLDQRENTTTSEGIKQRTCSGKLVDEEDNIAPKDRPQARSADNAIAQSEARERKHIKLVKTFLLIGVIVVLAVIVILIATLSSWKKTVETDMQSPPPTSAPTSYSEYWLSLFPETTISAILENTESPQSRAFEWLMEEIDILHNLTEERVVQRFTLATFYFANSEEQWLFSDNWLNHSVHECLWYSSLEDFYFIVEANIVFPLDHISPCEQDPAGYLEDGILYQGDGIIKHFWISFNDLMGSGIPPELYLLTELRSLALDGLNLTSTIPEELSSLPSLEYISMLSCGLYGSIPEVLGTSSRLGVVYFGFNSLTGTIPSSLFSLTESMRSFGLLENQLTGPFPTELGLLTNLLGIVFDGNLFTGTIPTELGQVSPLYSLDLSNLMLSGTIPAELAVLTDIAVLQLLNSGLLGTIPKWLGNMTMLDTLILADNSFTGIIPTELGLLTKLFSLWLGGNALSGTIPSELGTYEQMLALSLEINVLTGTIPTEFGQLTGVQQLFLHGNDLTGTVPLELGNVPFPPPYGQVLLHGNEDLFGVIPASLCSANNLTFDCSDLLCGCDWCNCSDIETSLILEGETTNDEDGQQLREANRTTEENQTST
ncbi:LRR receptor-like serine threonine-protein kinase [Seminavis robusta]|uniref:LRR receptor-like serine threonine-protein kinase n=1 Tax=Seminavis robusta TaxID=568900 RepID=A0A9N8D4T9_9STRA|nr:LRR receptor-like serine threonine-protein kinase [Seminavis robusta]|eukprot:Sro5_g004460.1 LRR receptor-like serine threonine-protein kinase (694) ;mRNA; f:157511-160162